MNANTEHQPPREGERGIELSNFTVWRGEIEAVRGVSLQLWAGKTAAIVGANGSGKTSLLEAIVGLIPFRGSLQVGGRAVLMSKPTQALQAGIALCPANRGIFHRLTVEENLWVAGHTLDRGELRHRIGEQFDRFASLVERRHVPAGQLSGGERQQLAIAKALIVRPRFLLLDEPARGLSPAAIQALLRTIDSLTEGGVTVLIVDQAADWFYPVVNRLLVMTNGEIVSDEQTTGDPQTDVARAYFDLKPENGKKVI